MGNLSIISYHIVVYIFTEGKYCVYHEVLESQNFSLQNNLLYGQLSETIQQRKTPKPGYKNTRF